MDQPISSILFKCKFIQAMYGKKNRMSYKFNIIDACMYECYTFITLLVDICMLYMAICKTLLNRCCISLTVYESLSDCELIYVTRAELLLITTESVAVFSIWISSKSFSSTGKSDLLSGTNSVMVCCCSL